jgi:tRNA dimethylallyltransferase
MPPLIAIVGPTSSGKTGLSIDLAREFKKQGIVAEIVSADSRQVYKGLDLLSGKVTKREM